jgi:hypothetical protein
MSDTSNSNDPRLLIYLAGFVVLGLIVLEILSMLVSLVVICLIAGAVYFGASTGYKLAKDSEVWEDRRIAKHKAMKKAYQKEKEYFASQGQEFMNEVIDGHLNDETRKLYDKPDRLAKTVTVVKKARELFK